MIKFFRLAFSCFLLLFLFGMPVFADTTPGAITESVEIFQDENLPANITLVVNSPDNSDRLSAIENSINSLSVNDNNSDFGEVVLQSVSVSTERVSASDANGFKAVMLGLMGDYETVITDYEYRTATGNVQHSIDVSPDYSWIGSCALFSIVVFCFFKMVGAFLCRE